MPPRAQRGHGAIDHIPPDRALQLVVDERQRGVGAHATGVRPGVAVTDTLEVLCERERHHGAAVDQRERRDLGPVEQLLDDHGRARFTERTVLEALTERLVGGRPVEGHRHALACREAVGLHDSAPTQIVDVRAGGVDLRERRSARGGDAAIEHHALREGFRPFQPGGIGVGPKTGMPRARSRSARPATSGASGPITTRSGRSRSTRSTWPDTSSAATPGSVRARPAIPAFPGATIMSSTRGLRGEPPRERVLSASASDDEHLHRAVDGDAAALHGESVSTRVQADRGYPTGRLCSRAGPTLTTETGTPTDSSIRRT